MYTCPMHPEVQEEKPGRCPKCGMQLVLADGKKKPIIVGGDRGLGQVTWKSYLPLIVIFSLIALASFVASWNPIGFSVFKFISYFMAGFFIVFAGFKLMDLEGFVHGYMTYDLLAQRSPVYAHLYPFIELGFGLAMLGGAQNPALLWTEFAVMVFSGIGVAIKLAKREEFQCACLGTFLKVPLTTVTLIEDFGMAALALLLLVK